MEIDVDEGSLSPAERRAIWRVLYVGEALERVCGGVLTPIFQEMSDTGPKPRVVVPLLTAAVETGMSIVLLASYRYTRDCFILARSLYEGLLNIAYICSEGDGVAEQAIQHSLQRQRRDSERKTKAGKLTVQVSAHGLLPMEEVQGLKKALNRFTKKKGGERIAWTKLSIVERIDAVAAKYGLKGSSWFSMGYAFMYRDASDFTHSTLHGALKRSGFAGPSQWVRGDDNDRSGEYDNLYLLLRVIVLATSDVIAILQDVGVSPDWDRRVKGLMGEMHRAIKEGL